MTENEIAILAAVIIKRLGLTKQEVLDAIEKGISNAFPLGISEAISEAIRDSMPWPSEIENAIYCGIVRAHDKPNR